MRKGEKGILVGIGLFAVIAMIGKFLFFKEPMGNEREIPFYSTASPELAKSASVLMRQYDCRNCHVFWGKRDIMQAVPAPSLDGVGSLKTRQWLMDYLSAVNPQAIVTSRLKKEYQMPSYASLPESQRAMIADYLSSLKVRDWYLEEAKKAEFEKLTGKTYLP